MKQLSVYHYMLSVKMDIAANINSALEHKYINHAAQPPWLIDYLTD